jgi:hypothetical protein
MSPTEFAEWVAFFKIVGEESKKQTNRAKGGKTIA